MRVAMPLDAVGARAFAAAWIDAWNAHDLGRILSHYAPDFSMASPLIREIVGEPSGVLHGHRAVGDYWAKALARRPDLHFTLTGLSLGATSVVIHYQNQQGRQGAESFEFNVDGLVHRARAHYAIPLEPLS